jgi:hypothetical protein
MQGEGTESFANDWQKQFGARVDCSAKHLGRNFEGNAEYLFSDMLVEMGQRYLQVAKEGGKSRCCFGNRRRYGLLSSFQSFTVAEAVAIGASFIVDTLNFLCARQVQRGL